MSMRMVPVSSLFRKMVRVVHDTAKKLGKQVELELVGEKTEVDKTLVEQIADPLLHIIRNAVDHGMEMPEERQAAGKPTNGTILLEARHVGNEVWIISQDDGKGIGLTLRRVGLLGGDIPEIKNMKDIVALGEIIKLGEPEGKLIYTELKGESGMKKNDIKDSEARKAIAKLQEENKALALQLAADTLKAHRKDIATFCDEAKVDGRVLPAWEDAGSGSSWSASIPRRP